MNNYQAYKWQQKQNQAKKPPVVWYVDDPPSSMKKMGYNKYSTEVTFLWRREENITYKLKGVSSYYGAFSGVSYLSLESLRYVGRNLAFELSDHLKLWSETLVYYVHLKQFDKIDWALTGEIFQSRYGPINLRELDTHVVTFDQTSVRVFNPYHQLTNEHQYKLWQRGAKLKRVLHGSKN